MRFSTLVITFLYRGFPLVFSPFVLPGFEAPCSIQGLRLPLFFFPAFLRVSFPRLGWGRKGVTHWGRSWFTPFFHPRREFSHLLGGSYQPFIFKERHLIFLRPPVGILLYTQDTPLCGVKEAEPQKSSSWG